MTIRKANNKINGAAVRDMKPSTGGWAIATYPRMIKIIAMLKIWRFFLPNGKTPVCFFFCLFCCAIVFAFLICFITNRNLKVQFLQFKSFMLHRYRPRIARIERINTDLVFIYPCAKICSLIHGYHALVHVFLTTKISLRRVPFFLIKKEPKNQGQLKFTWAASEIPEKFHFSAEFLHLLFVGKFQNGRLKK